MIHLQGLGVVGSTIAWYLVKRGLQFTWDDNDSPFTAWRASAGSIWPSSPTYQTWGHWIHEEPWVRFVEKVTYWSPGDGNKIIPRAHPDPAYIVNVEAFVLATREHFAALRRDPVIGSQLIVAHGFDNRRLKYAEWGWSQKAHVTWPAEMLEISRPYRPALILRLRQWRIGFIYPVPGEHYRIGGDFIKQVNLHADPDVAGRVARWHEKVRDKLDPRVTLAPYGEPVEGWRPHGTFAYAPYIGKMVDGSWLARSLAAEGVMRAPLILDALARLLR